MKIAIPFKSTREAAYRLGKEAEQSGHSKLFPLPFNRFDQVDDTTWWLAPSAENPAYKYGKIVCTRKHFEPDMFVGLYVEKGLDPSKAGMGLSAKEKRYRIDSTWLWHDFIRDLKSGDIDRAAAVVERLCEQPATVALDGGMAEGDWDFVRFQYSGGQLSLSATGGSGRLSPLTSGQSLPQLAELIEKSIPAIEWVWIDIHIGLTFALDGDKVWDADAIWSKVCAPWAAWLR